MSKRSADEIYDFSEEESAADTLNEKKLKRKKLAAKKETSPAPFRGIKFDEVMPYKANPAEKFDKVVRLSDTEGMGVTSSNVSFFRIVKKDNEEAISTYQFALKNASLANTINSLNNVYKNLKK